MAAKEIMYGFVVILMALGGMGFMFNAANSTYLPFMVIETAEVNGENITRVGIPMQQFGNLSDEPNEIVGKVKEIQDKLAEGSQYRGLGIVNFAIQMFEVAWSAMILLVDILITSLTFFSNLLTIDALAPFGLDWIGSLFVALLGIAVIYQLVNIAFKGRFT